MSINDIVTVKGSQKPMELWTIDFNVDNLNSAKPKTPSKLERKLIHKYKKSMIGEIFLDVDDRA